MSRYKFGQKTLTGMVLLLLVACKPTVSIVSSDSMEERNLLELSSEILPPNIPEKEIFSYQWSVDYDDTLISEAKIISHPTQLTSANLIVGEAAENTTVSVSLIIKGTKNRTMKVTKEIAVTEVDFVRLPPMPDNPEKGLLGTDSDNDGVRDDVEIAILKLFPLSKDEREFYRAAAVMYTYSLTASQTETDVDDIEASRQDGIFASCLVDRYGVQGRKHLYTLNALLYDTLERFNAYKKYSAGRDGTTQGTVNASQEDCRLEQNY